MSSLLSAESARSSICLRGQLTSAHGDVYRSFPPVELGRAMLERLQRSGWRRYQLRLRIRVEVRDLLLHRAVVLICCSAQRTENVSALTSIECAVLLVLSCI